MPRWTWAFSTNAYTQFTLPHSLHEIAQAGYRGVEILADLPHLIPGRTVDGALHGLRALCDELQLLPVCLNVNTSAALDPRPGADGFWPALCEPHPLWRRRRVEYILDAIDAARELGCDAIAIASGRVGPSQSVGEAKALLKESLGIILPHAKDRRVRVGIEFEPGLLVGTRRDLEELLDEMGDPNLGANLDIGHVVVSDDNISNAIQALRGRIWNIHLEDIRGSVHEHLIPGEGEIRFEDVFGTLEEIGYDCSVTLELYPYKKDPSAAARRGLLHVQTLAP